MRILVLSHGHPDLGVGGAERAAYSLFQRLKADPTVERVTFVARAEHNAIGHSAFFGSFRGRPDEILACPPPVDAFTFQSHNFLLLKQLVEELVAFIRPDIVHVHHFLLWGTEIFELFRQAGVRVVFTLHEYAAICANFGQMIKTDGRLCHVASPAECALCIPSASAGKFFVRQTITQTLFRNVDLFVSPSRFLKDRYVAWGIPESQIVVIENVMDRDVRGQIEARAASGRLAPEAPSRRNDRVVFGYFGQINPFKGVDVLLEAAMMLPEEIRDRVEVRIHGENKHFREGEFGAKLETLFGKASPSVVRAMGGYRNQDVVELMSACDWVVVPSIWWENSPIVIQEARVAGRPLLCSNIGGMAEKMNPALDRLFMAGHPGALAEAIAEIVESSSPRSPASLAETARARILGDDAAYAEHIRIYGLKVPARQPALA
jgi:glycosyltransferase involved in cell wall biosynthesis